MPAIANCRAVIKTFPEIPAHPKKWQIYPHGHKNHTCLLALAIMVWYFTFFPLKC